LTQVLILAFFDIVFENTKSTGKKNAILKTALNTTKGGWKWIKPLTG
jgi:hypothetical protein